MATGYVSTLPLTPLLSDGYNRYRIRLYRAMIIDLHVHTSKGSGDSNLSPLQLVEAAQRIGLQGACLTEHSGPWDPFEVQRFASQYRPAVLLVPALEVESDVGHITVFGLDGYVEGIRDPKKLRRVADDAGAYVVLAHPFRNLFNTALNSVNLLYKKSALCPSTVEEASEHPIFQLVDAIEVANGGNSDQENAFAWKVARHLGKPMVGGSDAHSVNGIGKCVTVFPEPVSSPEEFLQALHAGHFYPATGLLIGNLQPFESGGD